jgi:hypothetical protein
VTLVIQVLVVLLVIQAPRGIRDRKETLDPPGIQAPREKLLLRVLPDLQGLLEHKEVRGIRVHRETRVTLGGLVQRVVMELQALQDLLVMLEYKAIQAHRGIAVLPAIRVLKVTLVLLVIQENKDQRGTRDGLVYKATQDLLVGLVLLQQLPVLQVLPGIQEQRVLVLLFLVLMLH